MRKEGRTPKQAVDPDLSSGSATSDPSSVTQDESLYLLRRTFLTCEMERRIAPRLPVCGEGVMREYLQLQLKAACPRSHREGFAHRLDDWKSLELPSEAHDRPLPLQSSGRPHGTVVSANDFGIRQNKVQIPAAT